MHITEEMLEQSLHKVDRKGCDLHLNPEFTG
jgi:hypothetical protein